MFVLSVFTTSHFQSRLNITINRENAYFIFQINLKKKIAIINVNKTIKKIVLLLLLKKKRKKVGG